MIKATIKQLGQRLIDNLPHHSRAKLVNRLLQLHTWEARRKLAGSKPIAVLIDNSVLAHGRTHETVNFTHKINWPSGGEPKEVSIPYRNPIAIKQKYSSEFYNNVRYLPGIAHLACIGLLTLKTSFELKSEQNHQPIGRYIGGQGLFDYSIFEGIGIESVDGYDVPDFDPNNFSMNPTINKVINSTDIDPLNIYLDNKESQINRVSESKDPLYVELAKLLPIKGNLDAWHIRTSERNGLFCFLTMDFKLRRAVEQNQNKEPIASLHTKVMTPEELGKSLGVFPIDPRVCEYSESDAVKSSARLRKELR